MLFSFSEAVYSNFLNKLILYKKFFDTIKNKFGEMINRLKRFDEKNRTSKIELLSIPYAIQMVLRLFPHKYCDDEVLKYNYLKAFVQTVIPGVDENENNMISMYSDSYYPFHFYCGYFIYDLNRRSKRLFENKEFIELPTENRTEVIQNALLGRELTRRLYNGAILMAQVSYYGAIYNEEEGCSLIDFPGRNGGYSKEESTYSFSSKFLDKELTTDGHPW